MKKNNNIIIKNTRATERRNNLIREIVNFMMDNPGLTRKDIADHFGISAPTLSSYLHSSELLRGLRKSAARTTVSMLPLAVKGFHDSLTSENEKIKYFASKDLLQSEQVLGPSRVDVTLNDTAGKTEEELRAIIAEAQALPAKTIDAEIIGD